MNLKVTVSVSIPWRKKQGRQQLSWEDEVNAVTQWKMGLNMPVDEGMQRWTEVIYLRRLGYTQVWNMCVLLHLWDYIWWKKCLYMYCKIISTYTARGRDHTAFRWDKIHTERFKITNISAFSIIRSEKLCDSKSKYLPSKTFWAHTFLIAYCNAGNRQKKERILQWIPSHWFIYSNSESAICNHKMYQYTYF